MKESNTKTSGSSKVSETKSGTKNHLSSQSNSSNSSSRGTACSSDKSSTPRRGNNPEGINQYTKKTGK